VAKRDAARVIPQVASAFYNEPTPSTAGALLEASLHHPEELVRVSAASSYFDLSATPQKALMVLKKGVSSRDALTQQVAAHALARLDPTNPSLRPLLRPARKPSRMKKSHTSTIIHGTWARSSPWWQPPSGDFWKYLHDNVDPSLYGAADRFEWSGGLL
jgi:HEAT repeat protein